MKKILLATLMLAAAAVGCSKNGGETTKPETEATQIALRGRSLRLDTRAPFDGSIGASNTLTALVLGSLTSGKYSNLYVSGMITFSDEVSQARFADGFLGSNSYPSSGSVFLCGLYPPTGWTVATIDEAQAQYTFIGNQDLMASGEVSTTKDEAKLGSYPALEFVHLLTRLDFQVVAESAESAAAWGKLTDISLVGNFNSSATVSLTDGTAPVASAFATQSVGWAVYEPTSDTKFANPVEIPSAIDNTTDAKVIESARVAGYTMIAPMVATGSNDFTISVTTKLDDQAAPITINDVRVGLKDKLGNTFTGDTQGKKFTITLIFRASDIKATAKVTDWVDGGSGNGEIS